MYYQKEKRPELGLPSRVAEEPGGSTAHTATLQFMQAYPCPRSWCTEQARRVRTLNRRLITKTAETVLLRLKPGWYPPRWTRAAVENQLLSIAV
jgi:hypothetical protein